MSSQSPQTRQLSHKTLSLGAILLVLLLSALDQTIVSTAMPTIIAQLQGIERYAWVTTAYLLTSTVLVPIYGKLGDIHGRRAILVSGLLLFLAGSMLCGLSGEFGRFPIIGDGMGQLIVFRGIQGLGAGGLATGAFGMIADLYSPAERGRMTGLFGGVFGLASVIGPLLGGFFTDHGTVHLAGMTIAGWRWIFYLNLPLGVAALFVLRTYLRPPHAHHNREPIDWPGAFLILATFVPLLLALSWGGNTYRWGSAVILGTFAIAAMAFILLLIVEKGRKHAIIPLGLFRNPVVARSNAALLILNLGFLGIVMFLPLFVQVVQRTGATASGMVMVPMMGGLIFGSIVAGRIASHTRRYKPSMLGGALLLLLGMVLLTQINASTGSVQLGLVMVIIGLGFGPTQSLFSVAIQNAAGRRHIGVATSSAQFSRQIGSTIGAAIFGALLTNNLAYELPRATPDLIDPRGGSSDLNLAQRLAMDPAVLRSMLARRGLTDAELDRVTALDQEGLRQAFANAITPLFRVGFLIAVIGLLILLFVPDLRLEGHEPSGERTPPEPVHSSE